MHSLDPIPNSPAFHPSPTPELNWKVPEILAPAGGRAQFFAALQAGADAVFLGLKNFNARGRAENFSIEDLKELLPLARQQGMKVLVTLNILLKDSELPRLVDDLCELQWLGIEAVIVQDLGVARLIRRQFPHLRMHASTQLAVHNKAGVLAAADLGFKRVVLARELTAQEVRKIRREVPAQLIEIEAFCHGSLCYSYSGLCFFSGAEDARSGNRGECAYTCRKPYKILNEPGHGFLFSMKDLDTSLDLEKLVYAGVDTLKIEGRKKDAQYVATTVGLYRQQLDRIFGRSTARVASKGERDFRRDMAFSFHRETTTFFVQGRYHENVIDLANPTHKGLLIGTVAAVHGRSIELLSSENLERFDGLRIDRPASLYHAQPQHGGTIKVSLQATQQKYANDVQQFSLRTFYVDGERVTSSQAGQRVRIQCPDDLALPQCGDQVFKIRSNELKRYTERLAQAPQGSRLRPLRFIDISFIFHAKGERGELEIRAQLAHLPLASIKITAERPRGSATLEKDLRETFAILGELQIEAGLRFEGDTHWFIPRSHLKQAKHQLLEKLQTAIPQLHAATRQEALNSLGQLRQPLVAEVQAPSSFQIKIDRLEYLPQLAAFQLQHADFKWDELIFEPKRAFLSQQKPAELFAILDNFCQERGLTLRLALPTVIRAWDEPLLKVWIKAFADLGGKAYELGNVGCLPLLRELGLDWEQLDLSSDFTLYGLNTEAILALKELGLSRCALSIEDDAQSLRDKLRQWPAVAAAPQAILYKDTPLFIAEACSLTALHQGCPTAQVCGYRTLEIANEAGERFFVAHETCKSIVYGAEALAWTQHKSLLEQEGIHLFRIDFLTRLYDAAALHQVLKAALEARALPQTHSANFLRELL